MELLFIRHGHGEHLIDYPNRLNTLHPDLTPYGVFQVNQLRNEISISNEDLVIVSPTKRTIRTAEILLQNKNYLISPLVGPRMFPQNSEFPFWHCDQIYSRDEILDFVQNSKILDFGLSDWDEGINRIDQEEFEGYGKQLLEWCLGIGKRVIIISHDGTITNYRLLLGEKGLTRKDFLGETGVYKTILEGNKGNSKRV